VETPVRGVFQLCFDCHVGTHVRVQRGTKSGDHVGTHVFYLLEKEIKLVSIFQQMAYFEEHYEKQQDLLLEIKQAKEGREGATRAQVKSWEKQIRKLDDLERDRVFILIIAAK